MSKKKTGVLLNRADVDTTTVNAEARTFDVVFATETPVFRSPWWSDENFNEVLAIDKASIRTERLDSGGMPLINNHNQYAGILGQMGRVVSYTIDSAKKEARATIQFSSQEQYAGVFKDIQEGIIRNISVGYKVWKYDRSKLNPQDSKEVPTYRAIDWEPMEISLVSVPADYKSSVRSEGEENDIEILNYKIENRSDMENTLMEQIRSEVRAAGLPEAFAEELIGRSGMTLDTAKAEIAAKRAEPAKPAAAPPAVPAAPAADGIDANRAVELERERVAGINTVAAKYSNKLERSFVDTLLGKQANGGYLTVDEARMAILEKLAESDVNVAGGGARARGMDMRDTNEPMIEALMERAMPGSVQRYHKLDKPNEVRGMSEAARDFRHMSMVDLCRSVCQRQGISVAGHSAEEIVKRALSTTDVTDLFTSTVKRFLRMFYEPIVPEWEPFSRRIPANDFRVKTGIKADMAVNFEEIAENGEYKESTIISNEKATLQLKTYGRKFSISRKTIINDDLSVLTRLPQMIGVGYRQFQSKKAWGLITNNSLCPDGNALFHSAHGNLGTASVISDDSLSAARTAQRRQKSPEGNELLITPKFLMVPPELETKAQKFLKTIYPTMVKDVNLWGSLEPFVNVYFTDPTAWYMVADPAAITADGMVHAYLDGQEGLYTESYISESNDALVIKARGDFDCAMWGHQGWYKNPGAAAVSAD